MVAAAPVVSTGVVGRVLGDRGMTAVAIMLLVTGAGLMLVRPHGLPTWVGPIGAAVVAFAVSAVTWEAATDALRTIRDPLLFLVFAVPLATTLDRVGVFGALAALVDGGRHLVAWLWLLAAGVTIVFNLDAAVVLLTPLWWRERRHGWASNGCWPAMAPGAGCRPSRSVPPERT